MTTAARILIVDDNEMNLDLYEAVLTEQNYGIAKARDGIEALDRFEKYQPDLVVVDLMMPRLNGIEFCARLRSSPRGQTVPILVLTGNTDPAVHQNARQNGATDVLAKPFGNTDLLQHVRALLKP
jgi:CheY-like chemotaxis protein